MAETLIDKLIVKLGLSGRSEFEAGASSATKKMNEAETASSNLEKSNKNLSKSHKDSAKGFAEVASGAAKFLAIIGGVAAVRAFANDIIFSNSELGRFSRNIGLSTEKVSAWGQAAEQVGGTAQGLQGTMDMLSKSQTELMLTGQSSLIPYFSALGVALVGANGKARAVDEIMLDLAERFSHMDRTTANNMGRMMGIDQGTMNLLLQGRKALQQQITEKVRDTAVTQAQADEAERLQRKIAELKQEWVAFGRKLLSDAAPVLSKVLEWFKSLGKWVMENKETVKTFLMIVAAGLTAIGIAAITIDPVVAAVVALAAAIALLKQDYDTWKGGGESLIDWAKWKPGIDATTAALKYLGEIAKDTFYTLFKGFETVLHLVNRDWGAAKKSFKEFGLGVLQTQAAANPYNIYARATGKTVAGTAIANPLVNKQLTPAEMQSYFEKAGWSKEQAAGIVANLMAESGGNSTAIGDHGKAYGLAQWHPDRQANFKKWAGKHIAASSAMEQLAFVQYELTKGTEQRAGELLKKARSAQEAGSIISQSYERPADRAGEALRRGSQAQAMASGVKPYLVASHKSTLSGIPNASAMMREANGTNGAAASVDNSKTVHVGEIKVYSAATDADGIARDIGNSMDFLFTSQANSGLN